MLDIFPRTSSVPRGKQFSKSKAEEKLTFEEQMTSIDKDQSKFSRQMDAIVFSILVIFFETRAFLKIGEYCSDTSQF